MHVNFSGLHSFYSNIHCIIMNLATRNIIYICSKITWFFSFHINLILLVGKSFIKERGLRRPSYNTICRDIEDPAITLFVGT